MSENETPASPLRKLLEAFRGGQISDLELIDREFERVVREESDESVLEAVELLENFISKDLQDAV